MMGQDLETSNLKTFFLLCFFSVKKCEVLIRNAANTPLIVNFIEILNSLGLFVKRTDGSIYIRSNGTFSLLVPETEIDVKGERLILYALCGLFSHYDSTVFLIDSTRQLKNADFSNLISTFESSCANFQYNQNCIPPIQMKGNRNFLPMSHSVPYNDLAFVLSLVLSGLHGVGKTSIFLPFENYTCYIKILEAFDVNINAIWCEDGSFRVDLRLPLEDVYAKYEIDSNNIF